MPPEKIEKLPYMDYWIGDRHCRLSHAELLASAHPGESGVTTVDLQPCAQTAPHKPHCSTPPEG